MVIKTIFKEKVKSKIFEVKQSFSCTDEIDFINKVRNLLCYVLQDRNGNLMNLKDKLNGDSEFS